MLACLYCQCVLLNDHAIPPALWNGQWKHVLGWASTASEITFATLWKIKHFEISSYSTSAVRLHWWQQWGRTLLTAFTGRRRKWDTQCPRMLKLIRAHSLALKVCPSSHQWGFPMEQAGGCCSISHVCAGQLCPCSCANHHNSRTGCTHVKISS